MTLRKKITKAMTTMNDAIVLSLLEYDPKAVLLDLGCESGKKTKTYVERIGTSNSYGIDISDVFTRQAKDNGIEVIKSDLNRKLPFEDSIFDVVIANQVIEHLFNLDVFVSEICRILKPGAYAVVSTDNLSSYYNLFALVLGYRPFACYYSRLIDIGNPFSKCYGKSIGKMSTGDHIKVLTYRTFKELFQIHGFKVETLRGAGYPGPRFLAKVLSVVDATHSHFIIIKVRKPKRGLSTYK